MLRFFILVIFAGWISATKIDGLFETESPCNVNNALTEVGNTTFNEAYMPNCPTFPCTVQQGDSYLMVMAFATGTDCERLNMISTYQFHDPVKNVTGLPFTYSDSNVASNVIAGKIRSFSFPITTYDVQNPYSVIWDFKYYCEDTGIIITNYRFSYKFS